MNIESEHFSVSQELAVLRKAKQTQNKQHLHRLPPNAKIQRRPINHAPIASPYAGASVPKIVYVSRRTPLMAAVKRVQKLLGHIEKRAMQRVSLIDKDSKRAMKELTEASEAMDKPGQKEAVLVKASGRAMEQALKVGEWFRSRETKMICQVEVSMGSASVVDDIIEVERDSEVDEATGQEGSGEDVTFEGFEDSNPTPARTTVVESSIVDETAIKAAASGEAGHEKSTRRRKRKRPMYDQDDLPEARLRWIKTVVVAISLKG